MKYFQTDDRDDYFASMHKEKKQRKYFTLKKDGVVIQQFQQSYCLTGFLKTLRTDESQRISKHDDLVEVCKTFGFELSVEETRR